MGVCQRPPPRLLAREEIVQVGDVKGPRRRGGGRWEQGGGAERGAGAGGAQGHQRVLPLARGLGPPPRTQPPRLLVPAGGESSPRSERAGGAPPGAPRPQHSPHQDGDEEGDAQEQAAPSHQEGVGVGDGAGAGFQDSSCGTEGTGARLRDWSGAGGAAPHKAPSPSQSPQPSSHLHRRQQHCPQRARAAAWPRSRRHHPLWGTARASGGGTRWDGAALSRGTFWGG